MTKKHFLLLIAFLFAIQLDAMKYKVHIYKLCDGVRTHLVTKSDDNDFHFRIDDCINICTDCDLEIVYESYNEDQLTTIPYLIYSSDLVYSPNGNSANVITGTLYEEEIYNDGKKYKIGQIDLSSITSMVKLGYIIVHGNYVYFNCLNIDPPNNKDDISLYDKEICLNDCFYLSELIKNNEIVDPLSGNIVSKANHGKDWKIDDEYVFNSHFRYCPTKPGKFEIKTTVKDACGEKEISGFLTVKDCYCDECCELIQSYSNKEHNEDINNFFIKCPTAEIKYLDNNFTITSKSFISKYKNNPYTISIPNCVDCGFSKTANENDCEKCCNEWGNFNSNFTVNNGLIVVPESILDCGNIQFVYSDGTILNTNKGFFNFLNARLISICFNSKNCLTCSHCLDIK